MNADAHHRLLLLRHAKSSWDTGEDSDFDRPLSSRGRRDLPRVARWMLEHALIPDCILCSGAVRTRETLGGLLPALGLTDHAVRYDDALYHAPAPRLLSAIQGMEESVGTLLLVAHNPGLDELLEGLCGGQPERTAKGKLMTTATIADLEVHGPWSALAESSCALIGLVRPKSLPDPR